MRAANYVLAIAAFAQGVVASSAWAAVAISADPWRLCPQSIATQERMQGIPKHLLSAIALAESARKHPTFGKPMPWPWTVMAEGKGRYLPTKAAAVEEVRQLQSRGIRNIDVGCMQVNLYYHSDAFSSLEQAFDPDTNVTYAGQYLTDLFQATGSWQEAAGTYHSATPELKLPYRQRVVQFWNEQQRLELAGSARFDSGLLVSGANGRSEAQQRIRSPAMLYSFAARRMTDQPLGRSGALSAGARLSATPITITPPLSPGSRDTGSIGRPVRSPAEEDAFAARRAQYLLELRRAIQDVKRSYAVQVVRDDPRGRTISQLR